MRLVALLALAIAGYAQIEVKGTGDHVALTITSQFSPSTKLNDLFFNLNSQSSTMVDPYVGLVFNAVVTPKEYLVGASLIGTVQKKDGSIITFKPKRMAQQMSGSTRYQLVDINDTTTMREGKTYRIAFVFDQDTPVADLISFSVKLQDPEKVARLTLSDLKKQAEDEAAKEATAEADAKAKKAAIEAEIREQKAELKKLADTCKVVYRTTANKKIADLTVREDEQVKACQALGLYRP
jgi:hypothetical protein